mmetsp:Transcript_16787/g.16663  ORF Transcript_16787/g.16663 Transcript_16787/m.16663 type:complete len:203 (+) Transcript_16787:174-782(+)
MTSNSKCGIGTKGIKDAGQLYSDITSTSYYNTLRYLLQLEETIRVYSKLFPFNIRGFRLASTSDKDVTSSKLLTIIELDGHLIVITLITNNTTSGTDQVNVSILQVILVYTTQSGEILVPSSFESSVIHCWCITTLIGLETIMAGIMKEGLIHSSCAPGQLLRHTSNIDTCSANHMVNIPFDKTHFKRILGCTISSSPTRGW